MKKLLLNSSLVLAFSVILILTTINSASAELVSTKKQAGSVSFSAVLNEKVRKSLE